MRGIDFSRAVFVRDQEATEAAGSSLVRHLKTGQILRLEGALGAGKTTLTRGIIAGLGGDPRQVSSPTFSLIHEYDSVWGPILHCDFCRLESPTEFDRLGGWEIFFARSLVIVEWFDRLGPVPKAFKNHVVTLEFFTEAEGRRLIWKPSSREKK